LVGNKSDLEDDRAILTERGRVLARQLGKMMKIINKMIQFVVVFVFGKKGFRIYSAFVMALNNLHVFFL
jgi:hypothetical protein